MKYVIPSHYRAEHISGLSRLLTFASAPVPVTQETLAENRSPMRFASGIPSQMLSSDMRVVNIDAYWRNDPLFGEVFDVFGDGSLRLFRTPGHTGGHVSAIAHGPERSVLLTFDAAPLRSNLELNVTSGRVSST